MTAWIVRGGKKFEDAEQDFLESASVGIGCGFGQQNADGMSDQVLRTGIQQFDQRRVKSVVSGKLTELLNFRDNIRLGDTIVMPRKASRGHRVALGEVTSGYEYWADEEWYPHRRRVRWLETDIPREQVGCCWQLSDQRTVFCVEEHNDG